jgi:hypothetical protein
MVISSSGALIRATENSTRIAERTVCWICYAIGGPKTGPGFAPIAEGLRLPTGHPKPDAVR